MVSLCYNRGVGTANPGIHLIVKGHDVTPLQEESYREIPLNGSDLVALVDEAKYTELSQFEWKPFPRPNGTFYAARNVKETHSTPKMTIFMHRQVLGMGTEDRRKVSHMNSRDTLDNRIENLLVGTRKGGDYKHPFSVVSVTPGICPVCEATFKTYPSRIKDGRGKFCSKECYKKAATTNPPKFVPHSDICDSCGHSFVKDRMNKKFCSQKCESAAGSRRYESNESNGSHLVTGEIAEMKVVADLLLKGYWVFRPVMLGCGFDYVALREDVVERVEVKVGRIHASTGNISAIRPQGQRKYAYTLLAIVINDFIVYERPEIENKKEEVA